MAADAGYTASRYESTQMRMACRAIGSVIVGRARAIVVVVGRRGMTDLADAIVNGWIAIIEAASTGSGVEHDR